jgi:hypothetical protein
MTRMATGLVMTCRWSLSRAPGVGNFLNFLYERADNWHSLRRELLRDNDLKTDAVCRTETRLPSASTPRSTMKRAASATDLASKPRTKKYHYSQHQLRPRPPEANTWSQLNVVWSTQVFVEIRTAGYFRAINPIVPAWRNSFVDRLFSKTPVNCFRPIPVRAMIQSTCQPRKHRQHARV